MRPYVPAMAFAFGALFLFIFDLLLRTLLLQGDFAEEAAILDLFVIFVIFMYAVPWERAWDRYIELVTTPPPPED